MTHLAIVFDALGDAAAALARTAAGSGRVVLVSDGRSPRVEALSKELHADLLVADHRMMDTGEGLVHSDIDLAARLARVHSETPLDAIIYATDALMDLSWYEPGLRSVSRGRALTGLLQRTSLVLNNPARFALLGHRAQALAGDAAISDFVVGFGYRSALSQMLIPEMLEVAIREPRPGVGSLHALDVVALDEGETVHVVTEWGLSRPGSLLVVGSDDSQGRALQAQIPADLAGRVVYGGSDQWWTQELLKATDSIEIAPLDGHAGTHVSSATSPFDADALPAVRSFPDSEAVSASYPSKLASTLRELLAEGSQAAVIATEDDSLAESFKDSRSLLADLAFVAAPTDPMGDLDPYRIRDDVVLIGPRAHHVAGRAAMLAKDLRSLIWWLTEPSLVSSAVIALVPGPPSSRPLAIRTTRSPSDLGSRLSPALLPMPNVRAEPHPEPPAFDPKLWIGQKRWSTRWRLALPWRWGLLPRAMRGRW